MAYHFTNDVPLQYVRGLIWGDLYGKPGPYATLCRDQNLSLRDVEQLSAHSVKITEPIVKGSPVPDLLGVGPYVVSQKALDIVSSLQPNGIFPIPLNLSLKEGGCPLPGYYVLQIRNFLDCVDFDRTLFLNGSGFEAAVKSGFRVGFNGKFVLKRSVADGSHLWRACEPAHKLHFISQELHERFESAGIHGWGIKACRWQPSH